jgi:AcrR family transcriptional regulator
MGRPREFDVDTTLEKARDLFWSNGYEETSLSDLETHLGIGRQSIYGAFGDKRSLFMAVLDRYISEQDKHRMLLTRPGAGVAAIGEFLTDVVAFLAAEPRRACLMIKTSLELDATDPEIGDRCALNQQALTRAFRNALTGAVRSGELSEETDIESAALFLVSQTYGLNVMSRNGSPPEVLAQVAAAAVASLH